MNDGDILDWIQQFACGFRHSLTEGEYYIDWFDKDGHIHATNGCNLRDAVIGAKLQSDGMYQAKPKPREWEIALTSDGYVKAVAKELIGWRDDHTVIKVREVMEE